MRYANVDAIHILPGEAKAARFVDEDGDEQVFIISLPAYDAIDAIAGAITVTVITEDAAFLATPAGYSNPPPMITPFPEGWNQ